MAPLQPVLPGDVDRQVGQRPPEVVGGVAVVLVAAEALVEDVGLAVDDDVARVHAQARDGGVVADLEDQRVRGRAVGARLEQHGVALRPELVGHLLAGDGVQLALDRGLRHRRVEHDDVGAQVPAGARDDARRAAGRAGAAAGAEHGAGDQAQRRDAGRQRPSQAVAGRPARAGSYFGHGSALSFLGASMRPGARAGEVSPGGGAEGGSAGLRTRGETVRPPAGSPGWSAVRSNCGRAAFVQCAYFSRAGSPVGVADRAGGEPESALQEDSEQRHVTDSQGAVGLSVDPCSAERELREVGGREVGFSLTGGLGRMDESAFRADTLGQTPW